MWTAKNQQALLEELRTLQSDKYQKFHSRLGVCHVMGVRIPDLDRISKKIVKAQQAEDYLEGYQKINYECDVIYGMLIGYTRTDPVKRLKYINYFADLIDNWAVCDYAAARWKFIKKAPDFYLDMIDALLASHQEWHCRLAYVLLLSYYLNDAYVGAVLERLKQPIHEAYYAQMAAAWLLSMGLAKYEEEFETLLQHHLFSSFVYQKALQKAVESDQVSPKRKEKYRKLKQIHQKQLTVE